MDKDSPRPSTSPLVVVNWDDHPLKHHPTFITFNMLCHVFPLVWKACCFRCLPLEWPPSQVSVLACVGLEWMMMRRWKRRVIRLKMGGTSFLESPRRVRETWKKAMEGRCHADRLDIVSWWIQILIYKRNYSSYMVTATVFLILGTPKSLTVCFSFFGTPVLRSWVVGWSAPGAQQSIPKWKVICLSLESSDLKEIEAILVGHWHPESGITLRILWDTFPSSRFAMQATILEASICRESSSFFFSFFSRFCFFYD